MSDEEPEGIECPDCRIVCDIKDSTIDPDGIYNGDIYHCDECWKDALAQLIADCNVKGKNTYIIVPVQSVLTSGRA